MSWLQHITSYSQVLLRVPVSLPSHNTKNLLLENKIFYNEVKLIKITGFVVSFILSAKHNYSEIAFFSAFFQKN